MGGSYEECRSLACGYVGLETGRRLVREGHEVYGIRRSLDPHLAANGIHPIIGDITKPQFWQQLRPEFGWIINCVSSSRGNADVYREVYLRANQFLMHWLNDTEIDRYVYTSSTSVFGQRDGSWVDESSQIEPLTDTARILVETEQCLLEAARTQSVPAVIVRLSGIYGPDRGFLFQKFVSGEAALDETGDRYMNMIHRDDAASGIISACQKGTPGQIYHLTDNQPVTQREFFEFLSQELDRPMPESSQSPSSPKKRAPTHKRVSNKKALEELDWHLTYPSFREGFAPEIAAILKSAADME
ncbi:MAG: NAD-dependent epimerase/dehydratase family protein [Verrucomicrobia bacterium]|nr:NAD-dependent epimerase/dehydratase family protein [Verrucomicrobiota bacterium]